jgi:uncharacterized protein (DUF2384 family)
MPKLREGARKIDRTHNRPLTTARQLKYPVAREHSLDPHSEISRASVTAHALATFGTPEKAEHWMNRPNSLFQGKTPRQAIEFDLVGVEAELVRIDHGIYM